MVNSKIKKGRRGGEQENVCRKQGLRYLSKNKDKKLTLSSQYLKVTRCPEKKHNMATNVMFSGTLTFCSLTKALINNHVHEAVM